jgi:hypothetical protein
MRMLSVALSLLVSCAKPINEPIKVNPLAPPAGKMETTDASKETSINAVVTSPSDDEKVEPPSQVSGAALHCSIASEMSTDDAVLGCQFADKNSPRVPAKLAAEPTLFSFATDSKVKVEKLRLAAGSKYDVAYVLKGLSRKEAESLARAKRFQFHSANSASQKSK